jgi:hypothetical protein
MHDVFEKKDKFFFNSLYSRNIAEDEDDKNPTLYIARS